MYESNSIAFSDFCGLVERLASVRPRAKGECQPERSKRQELVQRWIMHYKDMHAPGSEESLPAGTIVLWFRMMYPEQGVRRRYGIAETILASWLGDYLLLDPDLRAELASEWSRPAFDQRHGVTGCLGLRISKHWPQYPRSSNPLTLGRIDQLLDELATKSNASSNQAVRRFVPKASRARSRGDVLRDLFDPLPRTQVAIMVQIILRDLSPVLYPLPTASSTAALLKYNCNAHERMTVQQAMSLWHECMPDLYRVKADIDEVAVEVERAFRTGEEPQVPQLGIGTPILVPHTNKPQACKEAVKFLDGPTSVETKYDGERVQAHIDLSLPTASQVQIFSKSSKDSTKDRYRLIPIIRASLGLSIPSVKEVRDWLDLKPLVDKHDSSRHVTDAVVDPRLRRRSAEAAKAQTKWTRLIVEGEMIPWNEGVNGPTPFWQLTSAKTGSGIEEARDENRSARTGSTASDDEAHLTSLHLHIVWFEVLLLDHVSLLDAAFVSRRTVLRSVVRVIEGFSSLADFIEVDFSRSDALQELRARFAHVITERLEGLMLKPHNGMYNDLNENRRWIKLKKDFVKGCGDSLDVHVLGASWRKDRGRDQNVPTTVFTTFYIGFLAPGPAYMPRDGSSPKPHFVILSASSYGYQSALDRPRLCDLNSRILSASQLDFGLERKTSGPSTCGDFRRLAAPDGELDVFVSERCPFTFSLSSDLSTPDTIPWTIFVEPRVFEVVGAGFQKERGCPFHAVRWPRIAKVDRTDGDPVDLEQLQRIAHDAMFPPWLHDEDESQDPDSRWMAIQDATTSTYVGRRTNEYRRWLAKLEIADRDHADAKPRSYVEERYDQRDKDDEEDKGRDDRLSRHRSFNSGDVPLAQQSFEDALAEHAVKFEPVLDHKRRRIGNVVPSEVKYCSLLSNDLPTSRPLGTQTLSSSSSVSSTSRLSLALSEPTSSPSCVASRASSVVTEVNAEPADSPCLEYAWSIFPVPQLDEVCIPLPGLSYLKETNYFRHPLHVLWAAGWEVPGHPSFAQQREGIVYIESERAIESLKQLCGEALPLRKRRPVYLVDRKHFGQRTSVRSLAQSNRVLLW